MRHITNLEFHPESAALSFCAFKPDGSAHLFYDALGDDQAYACAFYRATFISQSVKDIEDAELLVSLDSLACIRDADAHPAIFIHDRFSSITSAMPPSMATDDNIRRRVSGSPRNTMPPKVAMTGTLSCTVAALAAFKTGNTVYQMA
jgi:hypothetical protein